MEIFQTTISEKYKLLVAHPITSHEPSTGLKNEVARYGFECQTILAPRGQNKIGTFSGDKPSIIIQVNSNAFGNNKIELPHNNRPLDSIAVYSDELRDMELVSPLIVGESFGQTYGEKLQGTTAEIALQLSLALENSDLNIEAIVNPENDTQVIITSKSLGDEILVQIISLGFDILGGTAPFSVLDIDGHVLYTPTSTHSGKKVIRGETNIDPISELIGSAENPTAFAQFLMSLRFSHVTSKDFTSIGRDKGLQTATVTKNGDSYVVTFDPLIKNTYTYNLLTGAFGQKYYQKVETVNDNLTASKNGGASSSIRIDGSLDFNKSAIKDFLDGL